MQLLPRFVRASQAAAAQAHAGDDGSEEGDDDETAKGMARLFAEVGEAYCALIATGLHLHIKLSVLRCFVLALLFFGTAQ